MDGANEPPVPIAASATRTENRVLSVSNNCIEGSRRFRKNIHSRRFQAKNYQQISAEAWATRLTNSLDIDLPSIPAWQSRKNTAILPSCLNPPAALILPHKINAAPQSTAIAESYSKRNNNPS